MVIEMTVSINAVLVVDITVLPSLCAVTTPEGVGLVPAELLTMLKLK